MLSRIKENLTRQWRGFQLLKALLEEEFSRLTKRNPEGVSRIELSVQELLRQLAGERHSLRRLVQGVSADAQRVRDLKGLVPDGAMTELEILLLHLDDSEQDSARQASKNHRLAMGLHKQSSNLLRFLHKEVQPKPEDVYTPHGRFYRPPVNQPSLVSGRL